MYYIHVYVIEIITTLAMLIHTLLNFSLGNNAYYQQSFHGKLSLLKCLRSKF